MSTSEGGVEVKTGGEGIFVPNHPISSVYENS